MNNIISAQEAFEAMLAGKDIMCRVAGEMLDFNDLDQFPATVFAKTGYEFCIKIDMINVAGIEFTKPLALDEYQEGQDVFVINTHNPSIYVVNFKTNALIESINSGFVQRDAENAKLQLKALSKILGCELNGDLSVVRLGKEPKKQQKPRTTRKKSEESTPTAEQAPIDVVEGPIGVNTPKLQKEAEDLIENNTLLEDLINRANKAETATEANALVRYTRTWTEEQRKPLIQAINTRLVELNDQNKPVSIEPPSLMVQIQNAPDLATLDTLEIDITGRHPDIQPKLMAYVRKRRNELEAVS